MGLPLPYEKITSKQYNILSISIRVNLIKIIIEKKLHKNVHHVA